MDYECGCDRGFFSSMELIGIGSFSRCYKAVTNHPDDPVFPRGSVVLVKQLKKVYHPDDQQTIRTIESETILLRKSLTHPNIVTTFRVCPLVPGRDVSIVKEYVDGFDLDHFIHWKNFRDRKDDLFDRIKISLQICEGLHFLHKNHIAHLDVKPGNILIERATMTVKLTDFGHALCTRNFLKSTDRPEKRCSCKAATIPYAAPELFLSNCDVDPKCDIYSLGVVMWEMKSKCYPYITFEDRYSLIFNIVNKKLNPESHHLNILRFHNSYRLSRETAVVQAENDLKDKIEHQYCALYRWCFRFEPVSRPSLTQILYILNSLSDMGG